MLIFILMLAFLSGFSFALGLSPFSWESRPRLQVLIGDEAAGQLKKKRDYLWFFIKKSAVINKPLTLLAIGKRIARDLELGQVDMKPEEFLFIKEIIIVGLFVAGTVFRFIQPEMIFFGFLMCFVTGYMMPEFWLKGKIKKIKTAIVRELPDSIDLLRLCVNAGLDFMLALKWVVEKSPPSVMTREFNIVMQEINLGKTRRDAIRDLSAKYELSELSSLARTLVQADKMGTSVAEALNILSEDMRLARFRRGEQLALKAPLKMLVPLLLFIFPVVGVLVAGPIFLDFMQNNPMKNLAR